MPYYRVYGKCYHREESEYFSEVVRAPSPLAALRRFARDSSGAERPSEIQWDGPTPQPLSLPTSQLGPGLSRPAQYQPLASFWAYERLYQVRSVRRVTPARVTCPTCGGSGLARDYTEASNA